MYASKGIGLAAVQIGILKRILVIDVSTKDEKKEPLSFINPVIKKVSDETLVLVLFLVFLESLICVLITEDLSNKLDCYILVSCFISSCHYSQILTQKTFSL